MTLDRSSMPLSSDSPDRMEGMVPGVRAGGFLFLSAIRGRDPKAGGHGGMIADPLEQARQALRNLEAVLKASGATLAHEERFFDFVAALPGAARRTGKARGHCAQNDALLGCA